MLIKQTLYIHLKFYFILFSLKATPMSDLQNSCLEKENSPNFKTGKGWKRTIQKEPKMHNKHLEEKV